MQEVKKPDRTGENKTTIRIGRTRRRRGVDEGTKKYKVNEGSLNVTIGYSV